jgi:hypothetical protein
VDLLNTSVVDMVMQLRVLRPMHQLRLRPLVLLQRRLVPAVLKVSLAARSKHIYGREGQGNSLNPQYLFESFDLGAHRLVGTQIY